MRHKSLTVAGATLIAFGLTGAGAQQPPPDDGHERIDWPDRSFPTLQDAIGACVTAAPS